MCAEINPGRSSRLTWHEPQDAHRRTWNVYRSCSDEPLRITGGWDQPSPMSPHTFPASSASSALSRPRASGGADGDRRQ